MINKNLFGQSFLWGTTISSFQNEGWSNADNKGESIWDRFSSDPSNIKNQDVINNASDFYIRYKDDIKLAASLNFKVFRFSLSWTRIFPNGEGDINNDGVEFYHNVIDECLRQNLEPWITLFHWDLPQKLSDIGGWTNRKIVNTFCNYADFCSKEFGTKVKHWIVVNEPMTFIGLGYFTGYHAPQKRGLTNFLKAAHHATLCNAEGARIIRKNVENSVIGTAFSCSYVKPLNNRIINKKAAKRVEALLNRFFIEPTLGLGYPTDILPGLNLITKFFEDGDEDKLKFDFDFIGLQYYFRVVTKFNLYPPILFASEIPPPQRTKKINAMGLEVYPKGILKILKFYSKYKGIKNIIITESGVCYKDHLANNKVYDIKRLTYHKKILKNILKAIKLGIPVNGYLIWTLIDNFEWKEGFEPRFGLIYNDFKTQKRIVKYSGEWFRKFLSS